MLSALRGSCDCGKSPHWVCWSVSLQAAVADMDLLFLCPVLLVLLLSRGSFTDLEKQRVDSGLEICILLLSLPLLYCGCTVPACGCRERGRDHWRGGRMVGEGGPRTTEQWSHCSLFLGLHTKCLTPCRSRDGFFSGVLPSTVLFLSTPASWVLSTFPSLLLGCPVGWQSRPVPGDHWLG